LIIPARNEEKRIGRLLESVRKQTLPPDEVIVVDNASTDSTAKIAKEYGATVVYESVTIRGKAWNTGFLASKGNFVAISGADFVLDPNWLTFLYQRITQNDSIGGVSATFLALNNEKLVPHLIELSSQVPRLGNAVMLYRRKAIQEAGSWNPKLHNAEDVDLAKRVMSKGYLIVHEPRAKAYHLYPERLSHFLGRQYEYGFWSMLIKKDENGLTRKDLFLMLTFPFIFIKHVPKIRVHPLLPLFLTLTTYTYTIGMWKALLSKRSVLEGSE
jgi:glycosyltransferase involved in cell wall biosynthesis